MNIESDRYFTGAMTAILLSFPFSIFDYLSYRFGFHNYPIWQIAASAYFHKSDVTSISAFVVGMITPLIVVGFTGVGVVYLLYYTGIDHYLFKGTSVSSLQWLVVFGIVLRTKIGRIDPIDAQTNLFHLGFHLFFGALIAAVIVRYKSNLVKQKI